MTVENMRTLYLDDRIVPLKVVFPISETERVSPEEWRVVGQRHAPLRSGEGYSPEARAKEPEGVVSVVQGRRATLQHPNRPRQDVPRRRLDLLPRLARVRIRRRRGIIIIQQQRNRGTEKEVEEEAQTTPYFYPSV